MACLRGCSCDCHTDESLRVAALGVDWRTLTASELALVAALAPGGELRRYPWILRQMRPDEVWPNVERTWHMLGMHVSRTRRKIAASGWTIRTQASVGLVLERLPTAALESPAWQHGHTRAARRALAHSV